MMTNKYRTAETLLMRMVGGMMIFGLMYSVVAQSAKGSNDLIGGHSQKHQELVDSNNITVSSEVSNTSSQEGKTTSSDKISDATQLPHNESEGNNASSNSEPNTNEILPTDPSMIPPSASTENPTNVPLPMDPNVGTMSEGPSEEASPVNSTESIEKKKHEIKIRYNEVRTQVEKEEAVAALRQAADKATTPEGQRQTLKAYYELLFKRMKQIDASLTERCDVMQGAYLRRLEQTTLEPTIPLSLPPSGPANSTNLPTSPAPKGKLHKKTSTHNVNQ